MKYTQLLTHDLLSRSEERQLIREAQSGNERSRERLILCNLRLCNQIALGYARPDEGVCAEDLIGDAVQGLMRAIETFDVESGYKLSTYAYKAIHQSVKRSDLLNAVIRLPEHVRDLQRKISAAEKDLAAAGNYAPSFQEIAEVSGVSVENVERHALLDETVRNVVSLDQPVGEDGEMRLSDILLTLEMDIELSEIHTDLDWFLSLLPETERFILTRSYGIPVKLSTDEIARLLGRSRQWVLVTRRETMKALQRLDRALNASVSEVSDAVSINDAHRMMKLRPVAVPEGISFVNSEVVKEKKTDAGDRQTAPEQLAFDL